MKATASYRRMPRRYAVVLGCEVEHAGDFIYGDGLDVAGADSATPIGPSCRICPRRDCDQRVSTGGTRAVDRSGSPHDRALRLRLITRNPGLVPGSTARQRKDLSLLYKA